MPRVKGAKPTKAQLRNLAQYKDKTDEEIDEIYSKMLLEALPTEEYENRIQEKLDEFGNDYDLTDMNINDKLQLRTLAQAFIDYEDISTLIYKKRMEGYTADTVYLFEKLGQERDRLQKSISNIQNDLNITRKARAGDKDESVLNEWTNIQNQAKEFYKKRMVYIFCPKCHMLLGTLWVHYADEQRNKITLYCNRDEGDGNICGEKVEVRITDTWEMRGVNIEDVPAYFR